MTTPFTSPFTTSPFTTSTASAAQQETPSARFGGLPLPRGLREDAENMPWSTFTATYSPSSGPLRLAAFGCTDTDRPSTRLGPQPRTYAATFAIGDRVERATVTSSGPVDALIAMLFDCGIFLDMFRFHQLESRDQTATFIQGGDGQHLEWAMGLADDKTESALRAVIACANRLMRVAWYAEIDHAAKKYTWRRR
ncbi:MAG: homocitrate synthase [Mycobacterium sp.]